MKQKCGKDYVNGTAKEGVNREDKREKTKRGWGSKRRCWWRWQNARKLWTKAQGWSEDGTCMKIIMKERNTRELKLCWRCWEKRHFKGKEEAKSLTGFAREEKETGGKNVHYEVQERTIRRERKNKKRNNGWQTRQRRRVIYYKESMKQYEAIQVHKKYHRSKRMAGSERQM